MKNLKVLWGTLSVLALVSACAKDKNLDDFKAQQFHTDMAQLQQLNGGYSGLLVSRKDGTTNLGAIMVTFEAKTSVANSTDQSKASARPIMTSNIDFVGATRMSIVASNSYYDPGSGQVHSEILIPRGTPAVNSLVVLDGRFDKGSGTISGTIEAQGYPNEGGSFLLIRNGKSLEDIVAQNKISSKPVLQGENFVGTTTFFDAKRTVKNVNMILLKPETTSQDDFLTLLSPINPVTVTLNYGQGALIQFTGANWDQQKAQSKLIGTTTIGGTPATAPAGTVTQPSQMTINCDYDSRAQSFVCNHILSGSNGAAQTVVKHVPAGTQPADPKDNSSTRDAISYSYNGEGYFADGTLPLAMTFTYDARTRLQEVTDLFLPTSEKTVRVSMVVMGIDKITKKPYVRSPLNPLTAVKWDALNKTLDANQTSSTGSSGLPLTLTLACRDFDASSPTYNFQCSYSSSLLSGGNVTLKFHSN